MHKALRYGAKDMVNAFCQAFNFYPHTHTHTHQGRTSEEPPSSKKAPS